ncbi:MAG: uroporphyrinogen decarboxylase family protein [bacterium]
MSYEDGLAAINLQMPKRVPRFEPSAESYHFELIKAVTGIEVSVDSSEEEQLRAAQAFLKAWNYDLYFGCEIANAELSAKATKMGHAVYAQRGADFDNDISCPFTDVEEVLSFDPWEVYGPRDEKQLIERFNKHYRTQCELYPTNVNTTGIYITLMSGMIKIFGWEMLLEAAGTDPNRFGNVVNRYSTWIEQYYRAMAQSEATVIYSHDDMVWTEGAFMHPSWYREYIFPNLKRLWQPLVDSGKKIIFICDGNYTQFVDDVAACGNAGFWFEIFTDLKHITEKFGKTHIIVGNADVRILTWGSKPQIRAEVERCMAAGKNCPGYFMCCSGHIPANVPVESALYYNQVYEELSKR